MFAQASLTFLMVGLLGTDISPPGSLRLFTLIRISGCRPSRAYTSMLLRNANSLTTWPPFLPGTLCSAANLLQTIILPSGHSLRSARTAFVSHSTFSNDGEWVFCRLEERDFFGVSKDWANL